MAIARRVVALEQELAALHAELDSTVASTVRREPTREAPSEERGIGGDVQGAVLNELKSRPGKALRAGELKTLIGGRAAKGSVESALLRLVSRGLIERQGRGAYSFRAGAAET
jgi:hypothetical protein